MKLTKLLSSVIVESVDRKLVYEVSDKVKNQLLTKFKNETSDDDETIINNIDYFERIKNGLPAEKRDIMKYSYQDLNSLVGSKKKVKTVEEIFNFFKKKEKGIENRELKTNIKKFLDIQDVLPKNRQDIKKYKYLDLVKLIRDNWGKVIGKKAFEKLRKERTDLTDDIILYYVSTYIDNYGELPENTPSILDMSFNELEHKLDALETKDKDFSSKKDYSGVEVVYDKDNLLIFQPKTKDQCIKLKNGRSWCTSREGGGNLYYNYRLENNLTLYYVIDEDKPFNDLDYAVVILVDRNGGKRLADGSNSGRYAGSTVISWDEITKKVSKLSGKEDLFVPKPLTDEEQSLLRQFKNKKVGDDPIKELGGEKETEMWLEMNSPRLSTEQYKNITPELKKKYIALGMDLTSGQISVSESDVLKYYISKKLDSIKNKGLGNLTSEDIALLNNPLLKNVKSEMKNKFAKDIVTTGNKIDITYPTSNEAKFIALYGFNDIFKEIPETVQQILIENKSDSVLDIDVPEEITRFKDLQNIYLTKMVKSLPENIDKLENLEMLSLPESKNLTKLPKSILNMKSLMLINLEGCDNLTLPEGFTDKYAEMVEGNGFWILSEKGL